VLGMTAMLTNVSCTGSGMRTARSAGNPFNAAAVDPFEAERQPSQPLGELSDRREAQADRTIGRASIGRASLGGNSVVNAGLQSEEAELEAREIELASAVMFGEGDAFLEQPSPEATPFEDDCPPYTIQRSPAPPRTDCPPGMMTADHCLVCPEPTSEARQFADEYICDGGDRGEAAYLEGFEPQGLEPEDTVVQFRGSDGKRHLRKSNRVCIYSPRFAAVTSYTNVAEGVVDTPASGMNMTMRSRPMNNALAATPHRQTVGSQRLSMRARGSILETDVAAAGVNNDVAPAIHDTVVAQRSFKAFLNSGELRGDQAARIRHFLQAAAAWSKNQSPIIAAKTTAGIEVKAVNIPGEIDGIDLQKNRDILRIVKLADRTTAVEGDEITFSLRYDNLGNTALSEVAILDHLMPRFELVDGTAESDRPAWFTTTPGEKGSTVLKWELKDELPAQSGGVITFKVRVR
jgi:uncharacterized repeat protein (TIGR01451 family)